MEINVVIARVWQTAMTTRVEALCGLLLFIRGEARLMRSNIEYRQIDGGCQRRRGSQICSHDRFVLSRSRSGDEENRGFGGSLCCGSWGGGQRGSCECAVHGRQVPVPGDDQGPGTLRCSANRPLTTCSCALTAQRSTRGLQTAVLPCPYLYRARTKPHRATVQHPTLIVLPG